MGKHIPESQVVRSDVKKRNQSNMVEIGIGAEASRDRVSEGLLEEVALSQDLGGEQEPVWEDGWGGVSGSGNGRS